jgi:hypothetical protein
MQNQTRAKQDLYDVEPVAQIVRQDTSGACEKFSSEALKAQGVDSHLRTSQTLSKLSLSEGYICVTKFDVG